jgi:hypothetical protein
LSDQVSHPYKTTSKIIVLCILGFMYVFLTANWKTKHCATNNRKQSLTSMCF